MKYFTKYLPVEGEIKEGDYVRRQNSGKVEGPCTDISLLILDKHDQKVKLFLCSRDIQVGDKVHHLNGVSKGIYKADSDLEDTCYIQTNIGGEQCTKSNWFKVIGEVSPDAIWVKEGMEFKEDEVRIPEPSSPVTKLTYFKCPSCNTFH